MTAPPTTPPRPQNPGLTPLVGIIATILLGWVLIQAAVILQPLVIAALLCSVLGPIVRALKKVHVPPWVTVVLFTTLLVVGAWQGGQLLFSQARGFVQSQKQRQAEQDETGAVQELAGLPAIQKFVRQELIKLELPSPVIDAIDEMDPTPHLIDLLTHVKDLSSGMLLVVLYMLFIFAEQATFQRKILSIADTRSEDARNVIESIGLGIQRYLSVKTVTSLATGVICFTGLQWLEVPYAALFGLMTFLLNYIPTFGSFAASVLPTLSAWATHGPGTAAIVAVLYLSVNVTLGSILEPRLLGRELNLSPLVILLSVVVWAGLWGVTGTFLAVPLAASLQIVLANIETTRPIALMLSAGPPRNAKGGTG